MPCAVTTAAWYATFALFVPAEMMRMVCTYQLHVRQRRLLAATAGGDDYELLFTAPAAARGEIAALSAICPLSRIGSVSPGQAGDISLVDAQNRPLPICKRGFDHFDPN